MLSLKHQRILLGITAGIAAYKGAELVRQLTRAGADVRVVLTPSAGQFIGKATLQALSGHVVRDDLFDPEHEAAMGHIELARWADLVLVAPASADFLARLAAGMANDLLTTLCLATPARIAVAPAMNQQMWANSATAANMALLRQRAVLQLGPAAGEQACGDVGPGRMLEPDALVAALRQALPAGRFDGCHAVVTAGPTREAVDAVRFLGNRSSGKMGYAVAQALAREGANVTLVSGPVTLQAPAGVRRIMVESALQMRDAVMQAVAGSDLFVAAAAVADYRPAEPMARKIKKTNETLELALVRNPDILAAVAALADRPFCVGFAAETDDLEKYAEDKRRSKQLDMIAANQVGHDQGFDKDNNALLVLWEGGRMALPEQPKQRLAERLISLIADRIDAQTTTEDS